MCKISLLERWGPGARMHARPEGETGAHLGGDCVVRKGGGGERLAKGRGGSVDSCGRHRGAPASAAWKGDDADSQGDNISCLQRPASFVSESGNT